jgi:hypothetical protein
MDRQPQRLKRSVTRRWSVAPNHLRSPMLLDYHGSQQPTRWLPGLLIIITITLLCILVPAVNHFFGFTSPFAPRTYLPTIGSVSRLWHLVIVGATLATILMLRQRSLWWLGPLLTLIGVTWIIPSSVSVIMHVGVFVSAACAPPRP